ncbi:MAG: PAS domain S-box protein [Acidobacteriota bacterium]
MKRRNEIVERYVAEAIHKVSGELAEKELRESERRRKRVEMELHETEVRFYQLVENARDIIYRYRLAPTRGFEYVSRVVTDIVGYTPQEHYADPDLPLKIVHPDDRQKLGKYRQGKGLLNERETFRCVHKNGRLVWLERVFVPVYDEAGDLVAIEGIARDITDRKGMEGMLRLIVEGTASVTGEGFFRQLVEHLCSALKMTYAFVTECLDNPPTRVRTLALWAGQGFGDNIEYDLEGTPCKEVIGGQLCYHPEGIQSLFPQDPNLVGLGAESYLGLPLCDSSDRVTGHLAVLHVEPIDEADRDRRISIVKVFAARTGAELERKHMEEVLRESEERFRLAFEKGPIGMAIVGLDHRLRKVNKAFCDMLGYSEQELRERTFVDITHPEDVNKSMSLAEQVFKRESPSYRLEKRYITKDGETLWGSLTTTVIRDEAGKALYALAMVENITQRKQAEDV